MKPIKLSELIEAVDLDFPETVTRIDLEEGCVVAVERSLLGALEEGDDEVVNDLPDWQKREGEIARAIAEDPGERFVEGPSQHDFHFS